MNSSPINFFCLDRQVKKVIAAGILGNALELYDYTLYGYFAAILAAQFFPVQDPLVTLMATYGIYASGFLFRPLGAIFISSIGDRYGRKRALELSILMMAVPTLFIGLLPTYAQIGLLAPLLLTFMRFLQGLSVGGELVGSFTYLVEHAEPHQKGFVGSWSVVGGFGGKLIGTFVAGIMSLLVAPAILGSWGWRIPFIAGVLFAGAGYYLRQKVSETPVFQNLKAEHSVARAPLKETIREFPQEIVAAIGIFVIQPASLHFLFIYFPIYLKTQLNYSLTDALFSNFLALALCIVLMPVGGWLSDRIGRYPLFLFGSVGIGLLSYPAFMMIASGNVTIVVFVHLLLSSFLALMYGPFPAYLSEQFPARIRFTASAISYNICVCLFGGLSPLICTWLIVVFETPMAPAGWLIFCSILSTGSLLLTRKQEVYA